MSDEMIDDNTSMVSKWQSMDSAPTDGQVILVQTPEHEARTASWEKRYWNTPGQFLAHPPASGLQYEGLNPIAWKLI